MVYERFSATEYTGNPLRTSFLLELNGFKFVEWLESFKIMLLRSPEHGKFVNVKNDPYHQYLPDKNYVGKDRIDLLVEGKDYEGRPIALTLRYYINMLPREELLRLVEEKQTGKTREKLCGSKTRNWRISSLTENDPIDFTSWLRSNPFSILLLEA